MSKKSQSQTEQTSKTHSSFRVNGVALAIAIVFYLSTFFGAIWMSESGVTGGVVILGESEMQITQSFADASQAYFDNPTALHLRAMNMLFERWKEDGALVTVPSIGVDTMNLSSLGGLVAPREVTKTPCHRQ